MHDVLVGTHACVGGCGGIPTFSAFSAAVNVLLLWWKDLWRRMIFYKMR